MKPELDPIFFLGGRDLEMVEIAHLLTAEGLPFADKGLAWGARLSDYRDEIEHALSAGKTPVTVELADDMPDAWPMRVHLISVDHHNERAGEPSSLRQIFTLLDLAPARFTRRLALVEANDTGHIPGMRAIGATNDEMLAIRREDRAAQGITPAEEVSGRAALATARRLAVPLAEGGMLTLVQCAHARTATIADPLALDPAFAHLPRDLLVLAPDSVHFFGAGPAVAALAATFKGGWRGGDLPHRGFWGHAEPGLPTGRAILAALGTDKVAADYGL